MDSCVVRRAPLLPIGSLTTCTTISWPSCTSSVIGGIGCVPAAAGVAFVARPSAGGDVRGTHDVRGVQERRALQADVDERRLHARHHPLHAALVDVADVAAARGAFDVHFLQHAVLDQRPRGSRAA